MSNFTYQRGKERLAEGALVFASADLRVALLMTNTTADTEKDKNTLSGFTTLDECNGANYARADLASVAKVRDDGNLIVYVDAADAAFANLGAGTRQNQGALVYVHVTNDSDSYPLCWIDTGGFPFDGTGATATIQWAALGILQLTG